jgi:PAS domain S-box-containing protein
MTGLFIKEKLLIKLLAFISIAMAVVLPLFNIFIMMPEFSRVLEDHEKEEAVSIATHLKSVYFSKATKIHQDSLPAGLTDEIERLKNDLKLAKIKIFSASGDVVYSTKRKDIGTVNREGYFHETVAKGKSHAEVIKKGVKTLSGGVSVSDVVETYVPIMSDGMFIGAFEIYKDITADKNRIERVIAGSSVCLSFAGLVFLAAVVITSYKARNAVNMRERAEREVAEANERLEQRVMERTAEYKKLSEEFDALLNAIPDNLLLLSSDLKVIWANKGAARSLGKEVSDLMGRHCYELWFKHSIPCENCYAIKSFRTGCVEFSEIITPDNRIWDVNAFPLKDEDGPVKSVIIVSRDITEKRRIENEMIKTDKLESLGMLAGGIAHDFNNMLAAISLKIASARMYADLRIRFSKN